MSDNYFHPASHVRHLIDLVTENEQVRRTSLPLVPTENLLSPLAGQVLASDLTNRYYLTDSGIWEYPQTEVAAAITDLAHRAFTSLYRVSFVNLRPLSGLSAMTVVLAALTTLGDTVLTLSPNDGGHGATAVVAERLGLHVAYLPVDVRSQTIDMPRYEALLSARNPRMVYFDHSNVLVPIPLPEVANATPEGTLLYYDCSHLLGLMADPDYFDPRDAGLRLLGGSLHKTFPGPQKGALLTSDAELNNRLELITNAFVSSHHMNSVAAAAVAAFEMLAFGIAYSRQVRINARSLGSALLAEGLAVQQVRGVVTDSHQVWLAAPGGAEAASHAVRDLKEVGIIVNCARIPTLRGEKGLRLGTTEVTRLGMTESEMVAIAGLVADRLLTRRSRHVVARDALELRRAFPKAQYCFGSLDELAEYAGE